MSFPEDGDNPNGEMCYDCEPEHFVKNEAIKGEFDVEDGEHWWCQEHHTIHFMESWED